MHGQEFISRAFPERMISPEYETVYFRIGGIAEKKQSFMRVLFSLQYAEMIPEQTRRPGPVQESGD
jgi:hypothetical protein